MNERVAGLESANPDARLAAIASRGSLEPGDLEFLVECLGETDKRVQRRAAELLATPAAAAPELDALLTRALASSDRRVRWGAAYCQLLRGREVMASLEVCAEYLGAEDSDLRWAAHGLLVHHAPRLGSSAVALVRSAAATMDPRRRKMALYCLRDIGAAGDPSEELARAAMEDPDVDVRLAAVAAYPVLASDTDRAAPALCARLDDADPRVRRAAAVALGKLGSRSERVLTALEHASLSADSGLCRAARGALERLRIHD